MPGLATGAASAAPASAIANATIEIKRIPSHSFTSPRDAIARRDAGAIRPRRPRRRGATVSFR
jgi:hypothetical protein